MHNKKIKKLNQLHYKFFLLFVGILILGVAYILAYSPHKTLAAATTPVYTYPPPTSLNGDKFVFTFTYGTSGGASNPTNYIDLTVKDNTTGTTQGPFEFDWNAKPTLCNLADQGCNAGYFINPSSTNSTAFTSFVLDPLAYVGPQGGQPEAPTDIAILGTQNSTVMNLSEYITSLSASIQVQIMVNNGISTVAANPTWNDASGKPPNSFEAGNLEFISPTQIYDTATETYYTTDGSGQYATNGTNFWNNGDAVYFPPKLTPIAEACAGGISVKASGPGNYLDVYLLPTVDIGGSCYFITVGTGTDNPEVASAATFYPAQGPLNPTFEQSSNEITLTSNNAMNMAYAMFEWEDSSSTTGQGGVGNIVTLTDTSNTLINLTAGTTAEDQSQSAAALAEAGATGTNDQIFTTSQCLDVPDFSFILVKYDSSNSSLTDLDISSPNTKGYFYDAQTSTSTWQEVWNNSALNCLFSLSGYLAPQSNGSTNPGAPSNPPYTYIANVSASVNNDVANNPSLGGGGNGGGTGTTTNSPELQCTISIFNPLTWLICPMISAAEGFVGELDSAISSLLNIDVSNYLGQDVPNSTGAEFYEAWNSFRIFALAIIIIAALILVIAQAVGVEAVSAYSLKKLLPRLIISVIAITLSWEILKLLIQISDDIGKDISGIIYAPFNNGTNSAVAKINSGAISGLAIVGASGLLVLGWLGALGFILTAAVAVLVGFATLVLRKILILVFIILAPIAIACAILPATQKVWKMWSSNFMRALVMFPLIAGFIAVGRVFAVIAGSGGSGFEDDIIKLVAWFGPYFMIPMTFRMAGGIMGSIGNIAGNISARGRKLTTGLSSSQAKQRIHKASTGGFQDRRLGRVYNRIGMGARVGKKGNFGFGEKGQTAIGIHRQSGAGETLKQNAALATMMLTDDPAGAVMALGGRSRADAQAAAHDLFSGDADGGVERTRLALQKTDLIGYSPQNQAAALQALPQNKSRAVGAGRFDIVQKGIDRLYGSGTAGSLAAAQTFQYGSRIGDRGDLGGAWNDPDLKARATDYRERAVAGGDTDITDDRATSYMVTMNGMSRTEPPALARGNPAQVQQYSDTIQHMMQYGNEDERKLAVTRAFELNSAKTYGSGDAQKIINDMMVSLGVHNEDLTPIEDQLARTLGNNAEGRPIMSGLALTRAARTYDQQTGRGPGSPNDPGNIGQQPPVIISPN